MTERQNSPGWATYLRVSDEDKQSPERSFAMQRQRIQEHLLIPSGLKFKREYTDMLTGTSPNRKDYQQMLADAEAGRFSHLGLYRADRFGRNAVEGLQAATKLISLGVNLRVANMPSLTPETPDGFFMFLIQMGLAQREVDVLRQRTRDGMEAKLRAGGWSNKAPEGYVNKERLIKSGKYERWVEMDPVAGKGLREAWDLLLTNRYTLLNICEELTRRGYTRSRGRPWAWSDPKNNKRKHALNRLQEIFHNSFYAGWVISKRFGIPFGEVRGRWEPIITTQEYERGVEILRQHDKEKSRTKRYFYLLKNLLWVEVDGTRYKMYCSTPTGRYRSYSYYITRAKPRGRMMRISCEEVERRIPHWLSWVQVGSELIPAIRVIYNGQVNQITSDDRDNQTTELKRRLSKLREEEARLGRLMITGKISEVVFDQLKSEWQEKVNNAQVNLDNLEQDAARHLDDLELALFLISKAHDLYERLDSQKRATLLQILAKRIIINAEGEIIDQELHSPFEYLFTLANGFRTKDKEDCGSVQFRLGSPIYRGNCHNNPHISGREHTFRGAIFLGAIRQVNCF